MRSKLKDFFFLTFELDTFRKDLQSLGNKMHPKATMTLMCQKHDKAPTWLACVLPDCLKRYAYSFFPTPCGSWLYLAS